MCQALPLKRSGRFSGLPPARRPGATWKPRFKPSVVQVRRLAPGTVNTSARDVLSDCQGRSRSWVPCPRGRGGCGNPRALCPPGVGPSALGSFRAKDHGREDAEPRALCVPCDLPVRPGRWLPMLCRAFRPGSARSFLQEPPDTLPADLGGEQRKGGLVPVQGQGASQSEGRADI